ncbi:MAG: hypothetical protein Q9210_005636 [Variospora velana]
MKEAVGRIVIFGRGAKGNKSTWATCFHAPKGPTVYMRGLTRRRESLAGDKIKPNAGEGTTGDLRPKFDPRHPSVSITWSSGSTISRSGFAVALRHARDRIAVVISDGGGDERLRNHNIMVGRSDSVLIITKPALRLMLLQPYALNQLAEVVDLLWLCGLERWGGREEMWAEVFAAGRRKKIGCIYVIHEYPPDDPPVQGASDVSIA